MPSPKGGQTPTVQLDLAVAQEVLSALESCAAVLKEASSARGSDPRLAGVAQRAQAARQALVQQAPALAPPKIPAPAQGQGQGQKTEGVIDKFFRRTFGRGNKRQQKTNGDPVPGQMDFLAQSGGAAGGAAGTFSVGAGQIPVVLPEPARGGTPKARKPSMTEDDLVRNVQITRVESQWIGGSDCGCRRNKISGHRCNPFCSNIGCDSSCHEREQSITMSGSRETGSSDE
eukprot:Hpha_TRINITY_DN14241_c0_g2::TRINITY_DN14241_c0_g2_i1::g.22143::m.22143